MREPFHSTPQVSVISNTNEGETEECKGVRKKGAVA